MADKTGGFDGSPVPWERRDGFVYDSEGEVICFSYGYESDDDLIAAAPELLEALRELIQTHEYSLRIGYERIIELGGDCDSPEIMINKDSSLNKAKVAIAKALGKQ
ncbi:hypothetical protein ACRGNN_000649 [Providencia stuartii]|uniref:hypothetical protein n=1 Tax=Providencia stuartii TaxID=588 RepID=UPI0018C7A1EA|nr:hypothetical protein [Providencia stuartii]EMD1716162.1 hypothetical protein [Providencia stuartii]MBG5906878.1 hypothetical protein [Providencia stuartii]HEM6896115.1 hypothetical protein [Providencia stuartii]